MPRLPLHAELDLPAESACLHLARSFARDAAALGGLAAEAAEELVLAVDEACTNVVEHAFEPGEEGRLRLRAELDEAAVTLCVADRGIPYVPESDPGKPDPGQRGLGFHLIQRSVDEVSWTLLGKEGKELRLVKRHPALPVTDHPEGPAPAPAGSPGHEPGGFRVRRMEPGDAVAVARALYRTYGYTYPTEDLYYPDRIRRLNATGQLLSVVAVSGAGEVVGHYALEMSGRARVAESGQAVVVPAVRGEGLLNRMRERLEEEARGLGMAGLYGQPVTSHTLSQQMNESFGAKVCGVTLGLVPRSFSFRGLRPELPQRETCMLYFKDLGTPPGTVHHAPERHRPLLSDLCTRLGIEAARGRPSAPSGESRVVVRLDASWGFGTVTVLRAGGTTAAEIRRARRGLCEHGHAEVVYLELPLAQPGCAALCEDAEEDGFFFAGLGPCFLEDGDALRLQYLNCPLDASQVKVFSPLGRELLGYIEAERGRVAGEGASAPAPPDGRGKP